MEERQYHLGFAFFPGIGPLTFSKILAYFGTAQDAWEASLVELRAAGLGPKTANDFISFRKKFSPENYEKALRRAQVSYLTQQDENYPKLLLQIKNPPIILYIKGSISFNTPENQVMIGVVGTRKVTEYGRQVTELLTGELAAAGCVIVSGLALGVDAIAHRTTVSSKGKTIAVLGSGVDECTPRENEGLYNSILASGGVVVSEFPLGQLPTVGSFPSRNRIIAGLSMGLLVTEGAEDSGSLITANNAFEFGRKVFTVPGPITSSLSKGPHALLQKGAKLVTSAKDILQEFALEARSKKVSEIKGDSADEQKVIDLLRNESLHFDELVRQTKIPSSQLAGILSLMEMKGLVQSFEAGMFGLWIND